MKGQVVGQRKKGGTVKNPNSEQKEKDFTGLFSELKDGITRKNL